jgi:C1A family cysteine protease
MISLLIIFSLCFLPNLIHSSVPFVLNPDCNQDECKDFNNTALYYANHLVGDSKIHIIFSSFEELTIMVIQTDKMASAIFNYTTLYNALSTKNYTGALRFNDTNLIDSFTLVIRRLIEFNDTNDSGMMDVNNNTTKSYFLSNLTMTNITFANNNTIQPVFEYQLDQVTKKIDFY